MSYPNRPSPTTSTIELPCGVHRDGELVRVAEILPMSGRVRKQIARKDIGNNPVKIADTILMACVAKVGDRRPDRPLFQRMLVGDRDFLLMRIGELTRGQEVSIQRDCSACGESNRFPFDLSAVEIYGLEDELELLEDGTTRVFRVGSEELGVQAALRFPTGADQHQVQGVARDNVVEGGQLMLRRCLVEWDGSQGPFAHDLIESLGLDVLDWLYAAFEAEMPGPEQVHEMVCDTCGRRSQVTVSISDFFVPRELEVKRSRKKRPRR